MSDSELHAFDHRLFRYVLDNIEPLLEGKMRDEIEGELDEHLLAFLKSEEDLEKGTQRDLILSFQEFLELEVTCGIVASQWKWNSYSRLHRWYVKTISEVRDQLTRETAEQWARTCVEQGQKLERTGLSLPAGIEIVRDWTVELRDLLLAIGRFDLLPAPKGFHSTPSHPNPQRVEVVGDNEVEPMPEARKSTKNERFVLPGLEDEVGLQEAAKILGCDKKTVTKLIEENVLEWRNAAPPSSTRPVYRLRASSVLKLRNSYSRGGANPAAPPKPKSPRKRSVASSGYEPKHIRRKDKS